MKTFDFIRNSARKTVYVDVDGTILESMKIPSGVKNAFVYWNENLSVTKIIWSRILILAVLKLLGSKLVIWTNRSIIHADVTFKSLGMTKNLFSEFYFYNGDKSKFYNKDMRLIDDDKKYLGVNTLTVEKI